MVASLTWIVPTSIAGSRSSLLLLLLLPPLVFAAAGGSPCAPRNSCEVTTSTVSTVCKFGVRAQDNEKTSNSSRSWNILTKLLRLSFSMHDEPQEATTTTAATSSSLGWFASPTKLCLVSVVGGVVLLMQPFQFAVCGESWLIHSHGSTEYRQCSMGMIVCQDHLFERFPSPNERTILGMVCNETSTFQSLDRRSNIWKQSKTINDWRRVTEFITKQQQQQHTNRTSI